MTAAPKDIGADLIVAVDAGCRWGLPPGWESLGADLLYFGFDPDETECARLNGLSSGHPGHLEFVPLALAERSGIRSVHLTAEPACSSFFPPKPDVVSRHAALGILDVTGVVGVAAARLDEWAVGRNLPRVDVMKLDTQGSELEIIRSAGRLLSDVLVVETEVEFNPLYSGQALFADVDAHLRRNGFVLWSLTNLAHYRRTGTSTISTGDYQAFDDAIVPFERQGGQLFWANALFVREALLLGAADPEAQDRAVRFAEGTRLSDLAMAIRSG